jgi:rRNA maturation protein Nop10
MSKQSMAIICPVCGEDTFVRREPVYEGFQKTGENIFCVSCAHAFDNEDEIPFKNISGPKVFSDADRSKKVEIFRSDEKGHNCRHCDHYTVNPFIQRCSLHSKEVQASDLCDSFIPKRKSKDRDDPLEKLIKKQESDLL